MICHIHIPRCAGVSIEKAYRLPHQHYTSEEWRDAMPTEVWKAAKVFTFLRNPWDRAHSWWRHRFAPGRHAYPLSFPDWITAAYRDRDPRYYEADMLRPYVDWLRAGVGFVGRFERLKEDWRRLVVWLGAEPPRELEHRNRGPDLGDWRAAYTDPDAELIGEWHREDLRCGYRFAA